MGSLRSNHHQRIFHFSHLAPPAWIKSIAEMRIGLAAELRTGSLSAAILTKLRSSGPPQITYPQGTGAQRVFSWRREDVHSRDQSNEDVKNGRGCCGVLALAGCAEQQSAAELSTQSIVTPPPETASTGTASTTAQANPTTAKPTVAKAVQIAVDPEEVRRQNLQAFCIKRWEDGGKGLRPAGAQTIEQKAYDDRQCASSQVTARRPNDRIRRAGEGPGLICVTFQRLPHFCPQDFSGFPNSVINIAG